MPKKLSLQNAKKQVVEYMIYIITMVITVALLLSFNMIIFSEEIAAIINEKSILPLILITVSVLVVLVISALVKHITVFMVRKRSREFGLYMLLGVEIQFNRVVLPEPDAPIILTKSPEFTEKLTRSSAFFRLFLVP